MKNKYGFLRTHHKIFPPIVNVETNNVCNIRCIHCPHSDIKRFIPWYEPHFLNLDIWDKIVDEVRRYNSTLRIAPDGEPLLSPDWIKQINYALQKKVRLLAFNTHGLLMEKDKMEVLFQDTPTLIAIEFSIDALWKTSYDKIRVGSDYVKVLNNVFNLAQEIKERKKKNIKIFVSIIIQPELENKEYEAFVKFWEPIVDKVITRRYVTNKGIMPSKPQADIKLKKRWPCLVPFTRIVISCDGKVRFCPDDWRKETTVGDLKKSSIKAIWNGKAMRELREAHLKCNFENHQPCNICNNWKVMRWGYDYTKVLEELEE